MNFLADYFIPLLISFFKKNQYNLIIFHGDEVLKVAFPYLVLSLKMKASIVLGERMCV